MSILFVRPCNTAVVHAILDTGRSAIILNPQPCSCTFSTHGSRGELLTKGPAPAFPKAISREQRSSFRRYVGLQTQRRLSEHRTLSIAALASRRLAVFRPAQACGHRQFRPVGLDGNCKFVGQSAQSHRFVKYDTSELAYYRVEPNRLCHRPPAAGRKGGARAQPGPTWPAFVGRMRRPSPMGNIPPAHAGLAELGATCVGRSVPRLGTISPAISGARGGGGGGGGRGGGGEGGGGGVGRAHLRDHGCHATPIRSCDAHRQLWRFGSSRRDGHSWQSCLDRDGCTVL